MGIPGAGARLGWVAAVILGWGGRLLAQSPDETAPRAVFQESLARYASLQTYSDQGTVVTEIETSAGTIHQETAFSIKLGKPNRYLVSWTQDNASSPIPSQVGAVWSDGTQAYLYMGIMKAYAKIGGDPAALGAATGISGGAAMTVPSLVLGGFGKGLLAPDHLIDPKLEGSEKIGGEECYVISGSSSISRQETFWISKSTYLVRQYRRSFEPPRGGMVLPVPTDEQLKQSLQSMGLPVTDAGLQKMRETMQKAQDALKEGGLKGGYSLETHESPAFPPLDAADFRFSPPEGTALKDSLFGGIAGN